MKQGEERTMRMWWDQLANNLGGDKKSRWLLLGAVGAVLLLVLKSIPSSPSATAEPARSAEAFAAQAEARLTDIVRCIAGAGECRVLVTLANGVEYVYATEQKTNTDRQEDGNRLTERDDSESTAIVVDTDNGRQGLLVTEIQPTVRGVVVVCEGGDREEVRQRIIEAVTVAMDLSSKRVCVTKLT